MSKSYSPIQRCEAQHTMVRTNQTEYECALEHGCPPGRHCPLSGCFANKFAAFRQPAEKKTEELSANDFKACA